MDTDYTQLPFKENKKIICDFLDQLKSTDNLVKSEEKVLSSSTYEIFQENENDIRLKLTVNDVTYWEHINAIDNIHEKIMRLIESKLDRFYGMLYVDVKKSPMVIGAVDNTKVKFYSKELSQEDMIRIWGENHAFKIFISHKDNCKKDAENLKMEFTKYGISCFVAHVDIEPTQAWANEIRNALFSCDACLALMSDGFHESNWTDQEVGCCLGRNLPVLAIIWPHQDEKGIPHSGKAPYGLLGISQGLRYNGNGKYASLVTEIMKYLLQNEIAQNAFIHEIGCSENWDKANNLAKFFEYIPTLKPYQLDDAITNWKSNSETRNAFAFTGEYQRSYGRGFAYYLTQWRNKLLQQSQGN